MTRVPTEPEEPGEDKVEAAVFRDHYQHNTSEIRHGDAFSSRYHEDGINKLF